MIRKNKNQHVPLYREVLREALISSWNKRRLWILAVFAAILQTGGTLDVILYSIKQMTVQGQTLFQSPWLSIFSSHSLLQGTHDLHSVFATIGLVQAFAYVSLIIGGILTCSILAQGALVYGLHAKSEGKTLRLRDCLAASGKHSWSIATLNILTIGLIWLSRFLLLIPFAQSIQHPNVASLIVYITMFFVFLLATFLFTTVHLFALNGIMLEDMTLVQAVEHAYGLYKKSWLIIIETGALMLGIGFIMVIIALGLFLVGIVPLFLLMIGAVLVQSTSLLVFGYGLSSLLLLIIMVVSGSYMVTFQYDTWGRLYQRITAGTATAKLHRWYHRIKHHNLGVGR